MKPRRRRSGPNAGTLEHPESEADLVALVERARRENVKLRVRGSAHSGSHAIYANHAELGPNQILELLPPEGDDINIQLDRFRALRRLPGKAFIVAADAGIHLSADPNEGGATSEHGLLNVLHETHQMMIADVGGITHQTVSGFISTASAGGSVKYSFEDSVVGVRIIDGNGTVHAVSKGDPEFGAMFGNLGLLGVVSEVSFECSATFDIHGTEAITTIKDCEVDLFGERNGRSLEQFLTDTDFARIEWWPQRGAERVVVWKAERLDHPLADDKIKPYRRFGTKPKLQQMVLCFVLTLLGNVDNLRRARKKLRIVYDELRGVSVLAATLFAWVLNFVLTVLHLIQRFMKAPLARVIPYVFPCLLRRFCPLDDPPRREAKEFWDRAWHGLPMDNELDDVLVPTAFTELFVPIGQATDLMKALRSYFEGGGDKHVAYLRTGFFAFEAYAAKASDSWLSPAYTTRAPNCPWRDGAFRFNAYWFALNYGAPEQGIFKSLWEYLRDEAHIEFRLHWGKFQPAYGKDAAQWRPFFKDQYPRWEDFLKLRSQMDPENTFLTSYWQDRFGL